MQEKSSEAGQVNDKQRSICFFGEPLLELGCDTFDMLSAKVAGDVFNTAVYLKRLQLFSKNTGRAGLFTCVGDDPLSQKLLTACAQHNIDKRWVYQNKSRTIGRYAVSLDDKGERSFRYWRNDSAARTLFSRVSESVAEEIAQSYEYFYFSGISLAVVENHLRDQMWQFFHSLKSKGVKLVFDTNYRAALWSDAKQAKAEFEKAFNLVELAFVGVEDCQPLFDFNYGSAQGLISIASQFNCPNLVIKNGDKPVLYRGRHGELSVSLKPAPKVIDTTAAGDSFNSGFLFGWLSDAPVADCIRLGAETAAIVIQHLGAIIDDKLFLTGIEPVIYALKMAGEQNNERLLMPAL